MAGTCVCVCVHLHIYHILCQYPHSTSTVGLSLQGGLVGKVRVRSWLMYFLYESPHKDRNVRLCVCVCVYNSKLERQCRCMFSPTWHANNFVGAFDGLMSDDLSAWLNVIFGSQKDRMAFVSQCFSPSQIFSASVILPVEEGLRCLQVLLGNIGDCYLMLDVRTSFIFYTLCSVWCFFP